MNFDKIKILIDLIILALQERKVIKKYLRQHRSKIKRAIEIVFYGFAEIVFVVYIVLGFALCFLLIIENASTTKSSSVLFVFIACAIPFKYLANEYKSRLNI